METNFKNDKNIDNNNSEDKTIETNFIIKNNNKYINSSNNIILNKINCPPVNLFKNNNKPSKEFKLLPKYIPDYKYNKIDENNDNINKNNMIIEDEGLNKEDFELINNPENDTYLTIADLFENNNNISNKESEKKKENKNNINCKDIINDDNKELGNLNLTEINNNLDIVNIDKEDSNNNLNIIDTSKRKYDKEIDKDVIEVSKNNKGIAGINELDKLLDTDNSLIKYHRENNNKIEDQVLEKNCNYICHTDEIYIGNKIDDFVDNNLEMRKRIEKKYTGNISVSIAAWNMQSLNKIYVKRQNKLEFIRGVLNENKFDFIFLIDVNDDKNMLLINGYKKYYDGRNMLFVKVNFFNEFITSRNCIFDKRSKLAFVYLTPASDDNILINNIIYLLSKEYTVIGDINFKTNKRLHRYVKIFVGEDSLQTGFLSKRSVRKFNTVAGPSDHFLIMGHVKCEIELDFPMRIKEVSEDVTYEYVESICNGKIPIVLPKVKPLQVYLNLNDREKVINNMMNDYLDNNVKNIYRRYRQVYYVGSKEPFLGTKVNNNIIETFAKHLDADNNKGYVNIQNVRPSKAYDGFITIAKTKSKATTFDFMSLESISAGVRSYLRGTHCRKTKEGEEFYEIYEVINNVIKVANHLKDSAIANTFFLVKNKKLEDYNDVRMIVIMPSFVKIFESLTYNVISDYFFHYFNRNDKVKYQFGGLKFSSTYLAMLDLRLKYERNNAAGVILLDLTKGFDSIDMELLVGCIEKFVNKGPTQDLLFAWTQIVYNIDYMMGNKRIRRKKGIPMGLSFSPLIFEFYLDCALRDIDKSRITGYVDDLAVVLKSVGDDLKIEDNRNFIFGLVDNLSLWGLIINDKSVLMSQNYLIRERFRDDFKIVDQDKYLGRLIYINGDGKIMPDDRYYNRRAFRSLTCPYWANFFVKRLVFNSGVISKFAYGLFMIATTDRSVRNNTFRNAWYFFKSGMPKFNYLQVVFAMRNVFRFFIDTYDIHKWLERKEKKESAMLIDTEVIDKIRIDIPQIKDAIVKLKPRWDVREQVSEFYKTKKFNDYLWKCFRKNVLANYVKYKREKNEDYYYNLSDFLNSKLFIHFGYLHNVVFLHADNNKRSKQIALFLFFKSLGNFLRDKLDKFNDRVIPSPTFKIGKIFENIDPQVDEIYKILPDTAWENIMRNKLKALWNIVDDLLWIAKNSKHKISKSLECKYKINSDYIDVYVDGSYNVKNNKIGYAYIFVKKGKKLSQGSNWEYDGESTYELKNIYGELRAAIIAVEKGIEMNALGVNLFYDFNGIQKYADYEWSSSEEFIISYANKMRSLRNQININFIKVYSHTGDKYNDKVDKLAKLACGISWHNNDNKEVKYNDEQRIFLRDMYKEIFKLLVIVDMTYMNNALNDLDIFEFLFNLRVKFSNLEEISLKMYKVAVIDDMDEEFDGSNDIFGKPDDL